MTIESRSGEKLDRLKAVLRECGSVCVGYSGGVDSVFLAKIALDVLGASNMLAVTGRSASYPAAQWQVARDCARELGIPHLEIDTNEMQDENYVANPSNRCYFCKSELWTKLAAVARERSLAVVLDGSNADDARDYRPGMQAAREHGVRSPLLEAGLTKAEIRTRSRELGLPTWDQPSAPCLSSRLPYGLAVTTERLQQVEAAEAVLRAHGFREFRVRHHGNAARLEVAATELPRAVQLAATLNGALGELGFTQVLLDVEGYRQGALNEQAQLVQLEGTISAIPLSSAGHGHDIAAVNAPLNELQDVRAMAARIKGRGFRYVALDLAFQEERA